MGESISATTHRILLNADTYKQANLRRETLSQHQPHRNAEAGPYTKVDADVLNMKAESDLTSSPVSATTPMGVEDTDQVQPTGDVMERPLELETRPTSKINQEKKRAADPDGANPPNQKKPFSHADGRDPRRPPPGQMSAPAKKPMAYLQSEKTRKQDEEAETRAKAWKSAESSRRNDIPFESPFQVLADMPIQRSSRQTKDVFARWLRDL